jgi:hypothetical protein
VLDSSNAVRACAASDTPVRPVDTETINVQAYWLEPPPAPSAAAGMHRFAIGAPPGRGGGGGRGAAGPAPRDACSSSPVAGQGRGGGGRGANAGLTAGQLTLRLTVDGQTYTQPVTIKPDPRGAPEGSGASTAANDDDN